MQRAKRLARRVLPYWALGWAWLVLAYISANRIDPDLGWHLVTGKYIVAHGIPAHDLFTYTARDFAWVNHEWLHDVLVYRLSETIGYGWTGAVFAAVWVGAFWLAARRRFAPVVLALVLLAIMPYVGVRGVTWSVLGLAVTLALLGDRAPDAGTFARRWWWFVPVFGLWANLHGGFVVGLGMVGMAAVWWRSWRLGLMGLLATAATLVNPYGWRVYEELWRTLSDGQLGGYITEWAPLTAGFHNLPYVVLVIVVLWLMRTRDLMWWRSVGFVAAAVWSNRHLPLLAVATIGLAQDQVAAGWQWLMAGLKRFEGGKAWRWWPIALGAAALLLLPLSVLALPMLQTGKSNNLDEEWAALRQLRDEPCRGRVFNDYNFGGAIIWTLPGVPTYIDGRMPSWRGPEGRYIDRYVEVLKGGDAARQEFARYNVQCVLIGTEHKQFVKWLGGQAEWRRVYDGRDVELWRRLP